MREEHYAKVETYRERFQKSVPFHHIVIDDFLDAGLADAVTREFPTTNIMPKSRDYIFGNKFELSSVAEQGQACGVLVQELLSSRFATFLRDVTDRELFVDPDFHGGGFHQGGDGSFLDMHVDFNVHPLHPNWLRVLNILLYLNPGWQPEYDGRLIVSADPTEPGLEFEPIFNRAVIMITDASTFHGYRKMSLPPGVTRRSVATYAYENIEVGSVRARTTAWDAQDAGLLKRLAAKYYGPAVKLKNRSFGSATTRNR